MSGKTKVQADSWQDNAEKWIAPPITSGGGIMMGFGIIVTVLAGLGLGSSDTTVGTIAAGSWFISGFLLIGFGFLARMKRLK